MKKYRFVVLSDIVQIIETKLNITWAMSCKAMAWGSFIFAYHQFE